MEAPLLTRKFLSDLLQVSLTEITRKLKKYETQLSHLHSNKVSLEVVRDLTKKYIANTQSPTRKVQCFFNFKGGTGKTTICYNIASLLYLFGYKVLVIDCDPQSHLTRCFLLQEDEHFEKEELGVFEILANNVAPQDTIISVLPELDIIPSSIKLSFLDSYLMNMIRREEVLQERLKGIKDQYDFILIDVNPSLSLLNRNVIVASDVVNIVCEAQPFSLSGMEMLLQEFSQLSRITPDSKVHYNIIVNKLEPNFISNLNVVATLRNTEELRHQLCDAVVRKCEDFNLSSRIHLPVPFFQSKNNSNAKKDLLSLGRDLLRRSTDFQSIKGNKDAA